MSHLTHDAVISEMHLSRQTTALVMTTLRLRSDNRNKNGASSRIQFAS